VLNNSGDVDDWDNVGSHDAAVCRGLIGSDILLTPTHRILFHGTTPRFSGIAPDVSWSGACHAFFGIIDKVYPFLAFSILMGRISQEVISLIVVEGQYILCFYSILRMFSALAARDLPGSNGVYLRFVSGEIAAVMGKV
jgi:hypothetical protein